MAAEEFEQVCRDEEAAFLRGHLLGADVCKLGVLERQHYSEWALPSFIVPKKNGTVRFLSDFREVNKRLIRKPFPTPKISTVLQEFEGFTFATALDLNMGSYTIRLDPDASKICTNSRGVNTHSRDCQWG